MEWLEVFLGFGLSLVFILVSVLLLFYAERKLSAFIQDRMGPTHVGKYGLLQPFADLIKLIQKESIIPSKAFKGLFILAPVMAFAAVFTGFALIPLWGEGSDLPTGLMLLLGIISLEAIAILMAGFASQSKFPWLGAWRAVAQMVSYEVPLSLCVLCFFWVFGTANLSEIEAIQTTGFPLAFQSILVFNFPDWGGFFQWNLIAMPFTWLLLPVFFICILAESNRSPFDIPEGESEIIGGFHTEYSGLLWAMFFLAEYAMMLVLSMVLAYLFLGGKASPIPHFGHQHFLSQASAIWLILKVWSLGFFMVWIRWTLPRFRIDRLMQLSWKVLTPVTLLVFLGLVILKP